MLQDIEHDLIIEAAEDEDPAAPLVLKMHASTRLPNGPFTRMRLTPVGEGSDWTYFVLSTRESRELLLALVNEYGHLPDGKVADVDWDHPKTWAAFVDQIEGIELYGPDDRRSPTLADLRFAPVDIVDCLLWPSPNDRVSTERANAIVETVSRHTADDPRIRVAAFDSRPESTLLRIVSTEALVAELLLNVNVERVRAPLRASITQESLSTASMPGNLSEPADTAIGIVDGVVNQANPLTGPYVAAMREFPAGHVFADADTHGTAVAGTAIWGDLDGLVSNGALSQPYPVISARVLDSAPGGDYVVTGLAHTTIESAIRWMVAEHHVRIVNLSITEQVPADSALRDELTATVDALARELDIVIVVSTGNRNRLEERHWLHDYPGYLTDPDARIAAPGDAALIVTVGSYAARDVPGGRYATSKVAIARRRQPSPFTRCGPTPGIGRAGTMKPEFVHHGGNWSWDSMTSTLDPREPGIAAVVAIPPRSGRIVGSSTGTSYAAAAVAHEVARIAERYPQAGANLLRALTALSARPIGNPLPSANTTQAIGYGEPDADRVLESEPQRVFLTYEGAIDTNRVLIHRVPIPAEYADGVRSRSFRVALAFDPPVRRARREYIAGTMTVELVRGVSAREIEEIYSRQPTQAAAAADEAVRRRPLPDAEHRPLQPGPTLTESNTLIRREFVNGTWDPDHRDYFLVVSHNQSRWTAAQRNNYPEQNYAVVIEIAEETASTLDLYAAIQAQLRGRVRVRG